VTIVDVRVAAYGCVYAGCGAADVEMEVCVQDLLRVAACDGVCVSVCV